MFLATLFLATAVFAAEPAKENPDKPVTVYLKGPKGERIGTAVISEKGSGVKIALKVAMLPPGEHGFHIHETGTCTGPKFDSAGGHYAGSKKNHGDVPDGPHAGDMKNITVKADGTAQLEIVNMDVTLAEISGKDSKALIIHEKPDDYKTQPSGNAGARIACGEIK